MPTSASAGRALIRTPASFTSTMRRVRSVRIIGFEERRNAVQNTGAYPSSCTSGPAPPKSPGDPGGVGPVATLPLSVDDR